MSTSAATKIDFRALPQTSKDDEFLLEAIAKANKVGNVVPVRDQYLLRLLYDELAQQQVNIGEIHKEVEQRIEVMRDAYDYCEKAQEILREAQELVAKATGKSIEEVMRDIELKRGSADEDMDEDDSNPDDDEVWQAKLLDYNNLQNRHKL